VTSNFIYRLIAGTTPEAPSARGSSLKPATTHDMIPEFYYQRRIFYSPAQQQFAQFPEKIQSDVESKNNTNNVSPSPTEKSSSTIMAAKNNNKTGDSFDRIQGVTENDVDDSKIGLKNDNQIPDVHIISNDHYVDSKGLNPLKDAKRESSTIIPMPTAGQNDVNSDEMKEAFRRKSAHYNGDADNYADDNIISRDGKSFDRRLIPTEKDEGVYNKEKNNNENNNNYSKTALSRNLQGTRDDGSIDTTVFLPNQVEDKKESHFLTSLKIRPSPPTDRIRMEGSESSQSKVTIKIGRIEVHAAEPHRPSTKRLSSAPSLSLKDYLKQRSEGRLL
jgi:hypothetical protein